MHDPSNGGQQVTKATGTTADHSHGRKHVTKATGGNS